MYMEYLETQSSCKQVKILMNQLEWKLKRFVLAWGMDMSASNMLWNSLFPWLIKHALISQIPVPFSKRTSRDWKNLPKEETNHSILKSDETGTASHLTLSFDRDNNWGWRVKVPCPRLRSYGVRGEPGLWATQLACLPVHYVTLPPCKPDFISQIEQWQGQLRPSLKHQN